MRQILFIICLLSLTLSHAGAQGILVGFSQPPALQAKAGNDTLVCSGHAVLLGSYPTAIGGKPSYVYLWSPPDGLNDPTSSNPTTTLTSTKTYMVSVTDGNGCTAVSFVNVRVDPCLGINENNLNGSISIFPNPSKGRFTITGLGNLESRLSEIQILNRLGQVVFRRDFSNQPIGDIEIEANLAESGFYFVRICLSDKIITQRLIIR